MVKISEFITKALFDEKDGYYKKKNPIGAKSDFITSPEISQVFGELLAGYILHNCLNYEGKISLVEMGAGRGVLFYDILSTFKKLAQKNEQIANLLSRMDFNIIEINPVLQNIQKEKLKDFKVNFYENLFDFSKGKETKIVFISNELFDCFAIDQYVLCEEGWRERIILEGEKRTFGLAPFTKEINDFVKSKIGNILLPLGAVYEYSKSGEEFMTSLCNILKCNGQIAINIDYGYIKNLFVNTLQAVKNHKKWDVLKDPSEADITSHVNFNALDAISKDHGLNSSLVTQREFLLGLGIENRRQSLLKNSPNNSKDINLAIDRLINCDEMGDLFKVHIIWK